MAISLPLFVLHSAPVEVQTLSAHLTTNLLQTVLLHGPLLPRLPNTSLLNFVHLLLRKLTNRLSDVVDETKGQETKTWSSSCKRRNRENEIERKREKKISDYRVFTEFVLRYLGFFYDRSGGGT